MDAQKSADKLRHAAERDPGPDKAKEKEKERREADTQSAEAYAELTQPGLSKGRPPAGGEFNRRTASVKRRHRRPLIH